MKRSLRAALLLSVLVLAGCARPANREQAKALASWLGSQSYSTWSTFYSRDRTPHQPASPDGLTLGSPNVFAAVGCNPKDLMSLDVLWGDRRTVRPLAKPMTVAVKEGDREQPVADFAEQTLRRLRHTSIAVSQAEDQGLRVTCVSFAPRPSEDSFLARWFLVENTGHAPRRPSLKLKLGAAGEWRRQEAGVWVKQSLALVSDTRLLSSGDDLEAVMGRLRPGERAAAALLLVAAKETSRLTQQVARAKTELTRLLPLLEETRSDWEAWCAKTPLNTGDERTDDLLDSLLCLVRSHVGPEAIHTGSLRYPHNRAWVRDSYWVQRALWELGRNDEARLSLDFFHRAWRTSGLASYYEIPSGRSTAYGYGGVELPHYFVLMVRDAEELGGAEGLAYWDMVQGCLDKAEVPASGLQPMNGDETWLLAAPVRELDDLLDNSWLLIASAEYGARLAERAGDPARAARYGAMAYRARLALTRFQPGTGEPAWYGIGLGGDGSLDFSLCPGVYARGVVLDVLPPSDSYLQAGLIASWQRLQYDRGLRAHSRSATIDGGTPGYVLWAAARMELPLDRDLLARLPRFCSATGNVWEFHDLYDPAWGGEKRRLWDSAVVLMGMAHSLFDLRREAGRLDVFPRPVAQPQPEEAAPSVFDAKAAEALLASAGPALILHDHSPDHAARVARALLRQRNKQYAIGAYAGEPPSDHSALIISPNLPPAGWTAAAGYWVRSWEGPPQLWVRNGGDVYLDTDPLLFDLLSYLPPQRDKPLPFPDANFDLVARYGEAPSGEAEVTAISTSQSASGHLNLAGDRLSLKPADTAFDVRVESAPGNLLKLTVIAPAARAEAAEITVTLPEGWWLVFARDMTGKWDHVNDPVAEYRLPGGEIKLTYHFRPSADSLSLTFDLARLKTVGRVSAEASAKADARRPYPHQTRSARSSYMAERRACSSIPLRVNSDMPALQERPVGCSRACPYG